MGVAHCPAPLQMLAGPVIAAPVQVMVTLQAVVVGAWAQPRLPLQRPVLPQGGLAGHIVATRGVPPAGMGEHLPTLLATRQLSQPPPQAPSQQTPSVQALLEQSAFATHGCPFGSLSPHRLSTLRQVRPPVQSPFDVQVVRHDGLVMLQTYGSQADVPDAVQVPVPLQLAAMVSVEPVQLCKRHPVLADQARQAPAPLQVPSLAQLPAAGEVATQRFFGSAPPEATAEHMPTLPDTLQLRQRPLVPAPSLQAVSQQTPSVQKPEVHWVAAVHCAPLGFRPHEPFAHVVGETQSASVVQLVRQALLTHKKLPQD